MSNVTNGTDVFHTIYPAASAGTYVIVMILMSTVSIIGVPGNALIIYIQLDLKKKFSTDYYILMMAVFDLVCAGFNAPLFVIKSTAVWHIVLASGSLCRLHAFLIYTSNTSSTLLLTAIALDRFYVTCKPFSITPNSWCKKAWRKCVGISVFSIIYAFGTSVIHTYDPSLEVCNFMKEYETIGIILSGFLAFLFMILLIVSAVCYMKVIILLRTRIIKVHPSTSSVNTICPRATLNSCTGSVGKLINQPGCSLNVNVGLVQPGQASVVNMLVTSAQASSQTASLMKTPPLLTKPTDHRKTPPPSTQSVSHLHWPPSLTQPVIRVKTAPLLTQPVGHGKIPPPSSQSAGHMLTPPPVTQSVSQVKMPTHMNSPQVYFCKEGSKFASCIHSPRALINFHNAPHVEKQNGLTPVNAVHLTNPNTKSIGNRTRSTNSTKEHSQRVLAATWCRAQTNRITLTVFLLTAVYFVTWVINCVSFALPRTASGPRGSFLNVSRKMYMINCLVNPLFYVVLSSKFRKKALAVLKKVKSKVTL